jgi:protocatechuate 3,4-dioxygenase beta subunit
MLHGDMSQNGPYCKPPAGTQPDFLYEAYASSRMRSPQRALVLVPQTLSELTGPVFGHDAVGEGHNDLTAQGAAPPQGERIVVSGRVLDGEGRPVPFTLVEVWQANAAGRYAHKMDQHDAPLDPNFTGGGRTLTDADGRYYFTTIRPGAYPWANHPNAWRPAHIHFSLFGPAFMTRLVTQMYFPGDPLLDFDPVLGSIADARARARLVSQFDWDLTMPGRALGFRFDIVLRGREATPLEK